MFSKSHSPRAATAVDIVKKTAMHCHRYFIKDIHIQKYKSLWEPNCLFMDSDECRLFRKF